METPRFFLRLDELPSVVEADGRVWPVFLTYDEASRVFSVRPNAFAKIAATMPFIRCDGRRLIEVARLVEWIRQNESQPRGRD